MISLTPHCVPCVGLLRSSLFEAVEKPIISIRLIIFRLTLRIDGAFDGVDEEEEDGDEEPAAGAEGFVLAAEHDAEVGEEEDGDEEGDGDGPYILCQGGPETES